MKENNKELISKSTREKLCSLYSDLPVEQEILVDRIKDEILSNISHYAKMADFRGPVEKVEAVFLKYAAQYSRDEEVILKRALVAKLALQLPAFLLKMNLPSCIFVLYPAAFGRLADFLSTNKDNMYNTTSDYYRKDIRFALGLTIPCGTFVVDLYSRIRLRSVILSVIKSGNISALIKYLRIGGYGPWFHMHIEQRYLNELNEQAHDRMYLRIADLLKWRLDIRGTTGSSWLYDPQLLKMSTRHAYIQKRPLERGAFFLRHGKGNVEQATMTSKSRRRLYEEGKYMPVEYSMLWPRKELIAWAEKQNKLSHDD